MKGVSPAWVACELDDMKVLPICVEDVLPDVSENLGGKREEGKTVELFTRAGYGRHIGIDGP